MLKRCASCGKPIYASADSIRTECGYCYAKAETGKLKPLPPSELDWRKPLYDAAVLMPPGEDARLRFSFLGDYKHAAQRMEICDGEIARKGRQPEPEPPHQRESHAATSLLASRISPGKRRKIGRQQPAAHAAEPVTNTGLPCSHEANPFNVLGATPRNTREELSILQKDEALFGNTQAADEALAALTHPDSRLEAEMHWFPQTESGEIERLLSHLETSRESNDLLAFVPRMPSALAQFNAVKLVLDTAPLENTWDFRAHILSLATLADALITEQVMDEINADRRQASFAPIEYPPHVEAHVERLLSEALSRLFARKPHSLTCNEAMALERHLARCYRSRDSGYHNSYFLELASDLLASS